ncbi:hypothetical protein BHM03_00024741 [Ensete ventricosum]|nr:hypothetical protein BHM03_00024741 [Ensete ventricosum]
MVLVLKNRGALYACIYPHTEGDADHTDVSESCGDAGVAGIQLLPSCLSKYDSRHDTFGRVTHHPRLSHLRNYGDGKVRLGSCLGSWPAALWHGDATMTGS